VNRTQLAARWRSIQSAVDWAAALLLAGVGLADVFLHHAPRPTWAAAILTLFVFLPLGLRRRFPLAVLTSVASASLLLTLVLGNPAKPDEVGFEVFLAWLLVSYSIAAHTGERRHIAGVAIASLAGLTWAVVSLLAGQSAGNDNLLPALLFAAVAWSVGRAIRRRQLLLQVLADRTKELEREREYRARAAVADERARIARELHDVVAHSVSVMVVQAQAGPRLLGDQEQARGAFRSIEASGREALVELRRLLGVLRTGDEQLAIGPQPGLASLGALIEQVREAGLGVELRIEGEQVPLPPGIDLSAYRIVQEALTNTLKHAGPAEAEIVVRYGSSALDLDVVDNGRGARASVNGSGHGLVGMRERTALYGGRLEAGPCEGGGYAVRARLPLAGGRR
jgi:signal transduction histidine kinase